jgi:hypothetical protein
MGIVKKKTLLYILFLVFISANALSQQSKEYVLFQPFASGASLGEVSLPSGTVPAKRSRHVVLNPIVADSNGLFYGDRLKLTLFDNRECEAIIKKVTQNVNGTVFLTADVEGYDNAYVTLSTTQNSSLGTISIPETGEEYSIQSGTDGQTHFLLEVDKEAIINLPCGVEPSFPSGVDSVMKSADAELLGAPLDPVNIDVMIVYTPAARQAAGGTKAKIDNVIAESINQSQIVLNNSNTFLTITLVHSAEVTYTESTDMGTDLDRLTYNDDSYMDDVHALRTQFGADLVCLFVYDDDEGGLAWGFVTAS